MVTDFIGRCPWVVMGPDPALVSCLRCEDVHEPPKKAIGWDALGAYVNGLAALHSACPDPSGPDDSAPRAPEPVFLGDEIHPVPADEPADAQPERSVARRLKNGSVMFDCRIHGTHTAVVVGQGANRRARCDQLAAGGHGAKCGEYVPHADIRGAAEEG